MTAACKNKPGDQLVRILQTAYRMHGVEHLEFSCKAAIGKVHGLGLSSLHFPVQKYQHFLQCMPESVCN